MMQGCERGIVGAEVVVGCGCASASAAAAPGGGGGGGDKVRVLVVDDSPVDRKIVERLLRRSGNTFEVMAVDGGKRALEALGLNEVDDDSCAINDCNIDIILTDYCMPEMNGYELLKAVKEHKLRRSIPVVIMSSENDSQRISRCLAIGAEDFILKPLTAVDIKHLSNYVRPSLSGPPSPSANKAGIKRKLSVEVVTENNEPERRPRPRLTGVAVA